MQYRSFRTCDRPINSPRLQLTAFFNPDKATVATAVWCCRRRVGLSFGGGSSWLYTQTAEPAHVSQTRGLEAREKLFDAGGLFDASPCADPYRCMSPLHHHHHDDRMECSECLMQTDKGHHNSSDIALHKHRGATPSKSRRQQWNHHPR